MNEELRKDMDDFFKELTRLFKVFEKRLEKITQNTQKEKRR